jgi:hypothetical protein
MSHNLGRRGERFAYFLLDATHPSYQGSLNRLDLHNRSFLPDNITSVVLNDAGTQALIKVVEMDTAVRKRLGVWAERVGGFTLDLLTTFDLDRMRTILRTSPDWSKTRSS